MEEQAKYAVAPVMVECSTCLKERGILSKYPEGTLCPVCASILDEEFMQKYTNCFRGCEVW